MIREIYEREAADYEVENELEKSLMSSVSLIVIEPTKLGDEAARWIRFGNFLHKTSVLSSVAALVLGTFHPERKFLYLSLGYCGLIGAGIYAASWQYDPCCKYQVESDSRNLQHLPLHDLSSSSPVVLVWKDDFRRKALHNTLSIVASVYCLYTSYQYALN